VNIAAVTSEYKRAKIENVPQLSCNLTIIVHLARWRSEMYWTITILISGIWEISDNISETVQDRDIVTIEDK